METATRTPSRPPLPPRGSSAGRLGYAAKTFGLVAEYVTRTANSPSGRSNISGGGGGGGGGGADLAESAVSKGDRSPSISQFLPRRPTSTSSIIRRQARPFNMALWMDDTDSFVGAAGMSGTTVGGMGGNFFEDVVKPCLIRKGTTSTQRHDLLVCWALDIARQCRVSLPAATSSVDTEEAFDALYATLSTMNNGLVGPGIFLDGSSATPHAPRGSINSAATPKSPSRRRIVSTKEVTTFLHYVSRENNVNEVLYGSALDLDSTPDGGGVTTQSTLGGVTASPSVVMMTPMQQLQLLLRVTLFCVGSLGRVMSDFDFRNRQRSDRRFSLQQSSDLDSTDEDNDQGAPRPLDVVVLTCAEFLLANVTRLGLHDTNGAVSSAHFDAAVLEDLCRLIQRLSMDSNAERSFGVLLGLSIHVLQVLDARKGILAPYLPPLLRYIDEQRSYYTMKADGAMMNGELVEMYDRLGDPFYKIVRVLRLLHEANDHQQRGGVQKNDTSVIVISDLHNDGTEDAALQEEKERTTKWLLLHTCLERFICYRSAERPYGKDVTQLFHLEMTARESLLEFERERFYSFLMFVKKTCPSHGVRVYLSGAKLWRIKDSEQQARDEILEEEARKYAFLCRVIEARGVLSLEKDPKKVANRLVPTTRRAMIASAYDGGQIAYPSHLDETGSVLSDGSPDRKLPAGSDSTPSSAGIRSGATPSRRPGSAKDEFFGGHKRQREVIHAEHSERLQVVQEQSDRWFILVLQHHLTLSDLDPSHVPAALRSSSPDEKERRRTEMEHLLYVMQRESQGVLQQSDMVAARRALERQELSMRNDVALEEELEREQFLMSAFEERIVGNAIREANRSRFHEEIQVALSCTLDEEAKERRDVLVAEANAFVSLSTAITTEFNEFFAAMEVHRTLACEAADRSAIAFSEDSAFDMIRSMCHLERKLNKDIFRRSLTAFEQEQHARQMEQQRREEHMLAFMEQERLDAIRDISALENSLRADAEHLEAVTFRTQIVGMARRNMLHCFETSARLVVDREATECLYQAAVDFLSAAVRTAELEANAADDCVNQESEGIIPHDGGAIDAATRRMERLVEQQIRHAQRGVFRYWLFDLKSQRSTHSTLLRLQADTSCMSDYYPTTTAIMDHSTATETSRDMTSSGGGHLMVVSPPRDTPPQIRTRTFLRPLMAAASASAASMRPSSAKGQNSFNLAEKMTNFNRVWLSDETKQQVRQYR